MVRRRGQRRVAHPDLWAGKPLRLVRGQSVAKQRPLNTVPLTVVADKVGRQIPPFNPVFRMRAVISREIKNISRLRHRKTICVRSKPGKPLPPNRHWPKKYDQKQPNVHWQIPLAVPLAEYGPDAMRATPRPIPPRSRPARPKHHNSAGSGTSVIATRRRQRL